MAGIIKIFPAINVYVGLGFYGKFHVKNLFIPYGKYFNMGYI